MSEAATAAAAPEIQERVDLGTIPGSVHVPRGMLEFWADPKSPYFRDYFEEDRRTILFCAGGGRSALAAGSNARSTVSFTVVCSFTVSRRVW